MSAYGRLIAACSLALLAPLLLPLVTGRVFTRDDLGALHLPFRYLYQESLRAGDLLLWTPAYHAGFFLFGEGEAGMAHPLHLALYRFLPLGPAFNLEIVGNYILLFAGTALWWRRLGITLEGALFGAMLFAFSGFTVFNLMHVNHIGTLAHAPWMLLALHVVLTAPTARQVSLGFAGLALSTGLQIVAGNPQYVWLTAIAVVYAIGCLALTGASWRRVALAVAALGCGGLVGAIQLLPTLEFLAESTRAAWSAESALSFSLSPLNLVQLWAPFAFEYRVAAPPSEQFLVHEFIVYNGAFTTAALAWVAIRFQSIGGDKPSGLSSIGRRPLLIALLVFAGVNLVLAFGSYGGLYSLLVGLPGLRSLRAPTRHLLLVHLAMSGVAALALDDLIAMTRRRETLEWRSLRPLAGLIALSVVTTLVTTSLAGSAWASAHGLLFSGPLRAAPWTVIVIVVCFLVVLAARGVRAALPLLIVATAADLGAWGYSYVLRYNPIKSIDELRIEATAPAEAKPGDVIQTFVGGRDAAAVLRGLRLTMGYTGLYAAQLLDPRDRITERLSGLTWEGDGNRWWRAGDVLPRGRLVSQSLTSANPRADVKAIDPVRVAIVDRDIVAGGPPGSAQLLHESPGHFEFETVAGGQQILVLTERFHRGWRIIVDGQATEPIRVYGDFLGCVVPDGRHRVTLRFLPDSVTAGRWASGAGLIVTAIGAVLLSRQRDRSTTAGSRRA